ncbi:unnamed protein product [Gemmata massiliana]|uniref:Uncharacterized protein n=1 Tax=Gemmata massiliana TaxID=1210884 RepID=A0A6P2CT31_9BACT|nr:unnamed protein product [Gemmata massiliana]
MLCPHCYGKHVVLLSGAWAPCPECAGIGELHCCDGLREQEECQYTMVSDRASTNFGPAPAPEAFSASEPKPAILPFRV